jgi:hypothetical protein
VLRLKGDGILSDHSIAESAGSGAESSKNCG